MLAWLFAFAGTLLVEMLVYTLGLRSRLGVAPAIAVALMVNALTHPVAWTLTGGRSWSAFVAVETCVWLVESALVWAWCRRARAALPVLDALVLALVANTLSAGAGLLLLPLISAGR